MKASDIKQMRAQLERMEEEYISSLEPCQNTNCNFNSERQTGGCTWSIFLEDCREYSQEPTHD